MVTSIPDRGDFAWVNFTPQSGHEQAGHRPALVLSPKTYHEKSSIVIACPITGNIEPWPWKVILPTGLAVEGAVLVDQIRAIDRDTRKLTHISPAPEEVLKETLAKLGVLLSISS